MSLFNHYRQSEEVIDAWRMLQDPAHLETALHLSHEKPVVIFKHSTRCGISAHAKHRLESDWSFSSDEIELFYLDLIAYRPISNQIAQELNVVHQSPQIIVLRNGKVVFDTSHHNISTDALRKVLVA